MRPASPLHFRRRKTGAESPARAIEGPQRHVGFAGETGGNPGDASAAMAAGQPLCSLPPLAFADTEDDKAALRIALAGVRELGAPASGEWGFE